MKLMALALRARNSNGDILVERVRLDGRGRVPIPSTIRKQLNLKEGDNLVWLVDGEGSTLTLIKEGIAADLLSEGLNKGKETRHPDHDVKSVHRASREV